MAQSLCILAPLIFYQYCIDLTFLFSFFNNYYENRKEAVAGNELSLVDAENWIAELTQNDAAIRQKATELVNAVDDPKFVNSKVYINLKQDVLLSIIFLPSSLFVLKRN